MIMSATASTKVRLTDTIQEEDARFAVRIYGHSIARLCFKEGYIDIDRVDIYEGEKGMLPVV